MTTVPAKTFDVIGLQAADLPHAGIAAAVARAGGIGLLDLEFARDSELVQRNFVQLCVSSDARIGLRVTPDSAKLARKLLAQADGRALTVVLAGTDSYKKLRKDAGLRTGDRAWAEISDPAQLDAIEGCDAIVARGHESGGWVGEYTSYILLQKLAGRTQLPLVVQGGVGVHSAAACRAAGAAGVIYDDQLLLLAESPLPISLQNELGRLNGAETRLLGELLDASCRVYARPASPVLKAAEEDNRQAEGGLLALDAWRQQTAARVAWSADGSTLLPLGQGIGLAATFRRRYGNVAKFVQAVRRESLKQIDQAAELRFLAERGALADSHGTRFPLAQGPMTRVSDSPAFAVEVAKGGALPFLALALMRGEQVREMLEQTAATIGDRPWGVGMLGFIPHALREEQCEAIWKCKPPFALIAGGRPDQAAEFEKRGIKTYIHAPAPALLKMYLEQGARRFVFEGRECGGHIGPLASFTLWEEMIDVLLEHVPPAEAKDVHLLFAGGIHDARSGAMVAAMTAPLAARGMKVGALMGTAYLFSEEIVTSGAVVPGFQEQALLCERTKNLETGPGHSTRCADTQFAHDFFEQRRQLIREGRSAEEIRDILEELNLGRLRIASKGVNRDDSGKVVEIGADRQLSDGMYMIGQVATLRREPVKVEALHDDVCNAGQRLLEDLSAARVERAVKAQPSDVAIIGIGTLLPKAGSADEFWYHVLHKDVALGEVPKTRWDWTLYFDGDRKARDKVYSRWGGFLDEVAFDPMRFGIPPKSMKAIDPMQLLTLEVARRAVADAGYADGGYDRANTSIVLGAGGGLGDLGLQYGVRAELPRFVENPDPSVWERLPEWTEESFSGSLLNVAAGRVANRMDFGGINFTVDAACASSLAAISIGVNELESGRSAMVLAGGVDTVQSPFGFMCFSKTQALSPTGQPKTFDQNADGITISEGLAVIVMKRLADAERDGDRIYAVIKAASGSSDGKALGLTAPRPEGQIRALRRAYAKAGFSPATLALAEAHGTGTAVGDRAEAQTITRALADEHAPAKSVALGSVKTLIGHTKASAGVSGLIKVALSLYHRVLPAHYGVDKPIDTIADPNSAVYLLKDARPWIAHPDHPRRGGVSAFGFGGTNFHAVLEEYRPANGGSSAASGANRWSSELCVLRAADDAALKQAIDKLLPALSTQGGKLTLAELALALAREADARRGQALTLAIVAGSLQGLAADLEAVLAHLTQGKPLPAHIRLNRATPAEAPAVALLFPGQGAQYVNMGREAALYFDEVREALELADRTLRDEIPGLLSRRILPPAAFDAETERRQTAELTDTRIAQPAIGALALGYHRLAARLGLSAQAAAGHSYGEYAALMAAGVLGAADFLKLSAIRGAAMASAAQSSVPGGMAAVQGKREAIAAVIAAYEGVKVANHNAPEQTVISGPKDAVAAAAKACDAAGMRATLLAVSGAFHTELVAGAQPPLSQAIQATAFARPAFAVYSNSTAQPYPAKPQDMQRQLDAHLLSSVEFVAEIEAMYAAGSRVFVELGPKGVCSNMVRQTLAGKPHVAVSLDGSGGGLRGLLLGLAELTAAGVALTLTRLFDGRDIAPVEPAQFVARAQPEALPKHFWMVSGGCARPLDDPQYRTGAKPQLDKAAADAAMARAQAERDTRLAAARTPPATPTALPAAPLAAPGLAALPPALGNEAMQAYQQTMRQFLALQERVMQQFLGGAPAAMPSLPVAAPAPVVAAPAVAPTQPSFAPPPSAPVAAAPAVVTRAPVAAPAFDAKKLLLDIVAERTGYPHDMLALEADLEADLGIDSIKRVEILGALQKALPGDAGTAMQAAMERFTKAKSLNAILAEAQPFLPAAGAASPAAVAPLAAVTPSAPALDLQALLLGIVAERTGYPQDMLALDADLEADLGIDSIKRVEILGALQKALPGDAGSGMQAAMERFTKAKSLNAILAEARAFAPAGVAAAAPALALSVASIAVAAPALDLQALLLGIVAERTGYPQDMLALDADLEADLGIDSIKRVEILGALQKALPAETAAQMQGGMERFTKAKSLNAILAEARTLGGLAAAPVATAVATTVAVAVSAPAAGFDAERTLLEIVAERTGYPQDMLAFDADLEADLGIDSIKRVEILGALQKLLPAALAETMQGRMERFTKAKSLRAILDEFAAIAGSGAPAPAAATLAATTPVAVATAAAVALDVSAQLLAIVAERTGYPQDMLAFDADLEADLGIDSIKRVEILGAFQKLLTAEAAARMQTEMERFTKAKSLSAIVAAYAELSAGTGAAAPLAAVPADDAAVEAPSTTIPRYLIKSQAMPLAAGNAELQGLAVVLGGPEGVRTALQTILTARGLTPVFIDAFDDSLAAALAGAQAEHGPARAVLHLHGLVGEEAASAADWQRLGARCVGSLFLAAKALEPQLAQIRLIAATRLGGTLGRDAFGSGAPIAGGVTGLTNCLRHEYPDAQIRSVDFDGQSDDEIATELVAELLANDPQPEAGWIGGERYGSVTVEQAATEHAFAPNLKPEAGWVLLVTGGARGITAEILEELAVPGLRYVLLGRTAEPAAESPATAALADAAALRKALLEAAIARGEKPKPVEIDRAVAATLVEREIRANLARLRARGAEVEYLACDVRQAEAFGAVIDEVYARHGRIDAVIHGAGVIEDKLLKDKTPESFARVFGTKLDPVFVLQHKLKADSLKWLSFFTSVAGRYGNRGQSDYAAANEALNRIAWSLSRAWPQTRVFAVNWGPWDAGMASDGVKRAFRDKGMEPIPVAAGRRFFADELAYGTRQDVEIVAGYGPWRLFGPTPAGTDAPTPAAAAGGSDYPLIRDALRMGPGGNMTLDHVFTLASDPYLIDHCMDGKAVVPAAGALEYMAQFVGAAWPGWHVVGMRDVRQMNGIVLEGGSRAVQLRARASSHSDLHGQTVTVEIIDPQRKLPFYRATAVLLQELPEATLAQAPVLPGEGIAIEAADAYREHLFHGPRFRLIERIDKLHGGGIAVAVKPSQIEGFVGAAGGRWVFDMGLMDVPPQLAFVWARVQQDKGALPAGFGSVSRYGREPLSGPLKLVMRLKPAPHEHAIAYDVDIIDAQGRVRIAIVDGTSTMSAGLNKLAPNHRDFISGLIA
ncbi:type I polyketide synthase [Solimonas variicoloris]|uniref:type I polyketide synthase n=1 Tax=Solimonas variicoloris TaxID=254408 RepID=UPI0003671202|nr:type I polyketide synthase [Solimonas variicoloris]